MWFAPYIDTYDRRGQLFQAFIYWLACRDRPVPDATVAIYPFKRSFVVGALAIDIQAGEHSMCYLPGRETPERVLVHQHGRGGSFLLRPGRDG